MQCKFFLVFFIIIVEQEFRVKTKCMFGPAHIVLQSHKSAL